MPFEDGFQLYLPSAWNTYELTEDQVNQGVLYLAGDASGADTAPAVSVVWAYSDGAETINDLATAIRQGGYQVDDLVSINGIPVFPTAWKMVTAARSCFSIPPTRTMYSA